MNTNVYNFIILYASAMLSKYFKIISFLIFIYTMNRAVEKLITEIESTGIKKMNKGMW